MESVTPPSLGYLCIYNPDLNADDEHIQDEIVFYYSSSSSQEDWSIDNQLRHIGLTQGVVEFSRGFSEGESVSSMETATSRIVAKELESDNWWVVACINFAKFQNEDRDDEFNPKDTSAAEILSAEIVSAYKRWRLHHGTFTDYLNSYSRQGLIDGLKDWWTSWCRNWTVSLHGKGSGLLFDGILTAKGSLKPETVEAAKAVIDKEEGVLDMLISRHDGVSNGQIENTGCVFAGKNLLSCESITDLLDWVDDCELCEDDTAYLEESGFVYHLLNPATYRNNRHLNDTTNSSNNFQNSMSSMASYIGSATADSLNQVMDMVSISSMSHFFSRGNTNNSNTTTTSSGSATASRKTSYSGSSNNNNSNNNNKHHTVAEDIAESRFLIGLYGNVLETDVDDEYSGSDDSDDEDDAPENNHNTEPSQLLQSQEISTPPQHKITHKQIHLNLINSSMFENFNIIIYRRRPFVFTLIYEPENSKILDNPQNYITLHRHLASLAEPMATDLDEPSFSAQIPTLPKKFYYIVMDPSQTAVQSSLPPIPSLPPVSELEKLDPTIAENLILERLELIHVHQSIAHIVTDHGIKENEKFLRTAKNWWVYWTKINEDEREVILARKWTKNGKPPTESLLGVLGRDTKIWLDRYKHYGKV